LARKGAVMADAAGRTGALARVVALVAALNLGYFAVEISVALAIGSVALLADSADFLEDAAVNLLILLGLSWSVRARARLGMVLAGVLLAPALAFLWALWSKLSAPVPPQGLALGLTGMGALAVNLGCALMLARVRRVGGQSDAGGLPVGAQRCGGECRDHRGGAGDGVPLALGLARRGGRAGGGGAEPGCGGRGLAGGPRRGARRQGRALIGCRPPCAPLWPGTVLRLEVRGVCF
jgi:hypothetical protein